MRTEAEVEAKLDQGWYWIYRAAEMGPRPVLDSAFWDGAEWARDGKRYPYAVQRAIREMLPGEIPGLVYVPKPKGA